MARNRSPEAVTARVAAVLRDSSALPFARSRTMAAAALPIAQMSGVS